MATDRKDYTVVTYAKDEQELRNNAIFIQMLREKLNIRKQNDNREKVGSRHFNTKMSSWINNSKCTLLIFTPSFVNKIWVKIFSKGETIDARTMAESKLILVFMPGFIKGELYSLLDKWNILKNPSVAFGTCWWEDIVAWKNLTDIIKEFDYVGGECINVVEFRRDMQYIMFNQPLPGKFTYIVSSDVYDQTIMASDLVHYLSRKADVFPLFQLATMPTIRTE